jgi:hypothetical protein
MIYNIIPSLIYLLCCTGIKCRKEAMAELIAKSEFEGTMKGTGKKSEKKYFLLL